MVVASKSVSPAGPICDQPLAATEAPTGATALTWFPYSGGKCTIVPWSRIRPSTPPGPQLKLRTTPLTVLPALTGAGGAVNPGGGGTRCAHADVSNSNVPRLANSVALARRPPIGDLQKPGLLCFAIAIGGHPSNLSVGNRNAKDREPTSVPEVLQKQRKLGIT
jgi:hypothetical protein